MQKRWFGSRVAPQVRQRFSVLSVAGCSSRVPQLVQNFIPGIQVRPQEGQILGSGSRRTSVPVGCDGEGSGLPGTRRARRSRRMSGTGTAAEFAASFPDRIIIP